MLLVDRQSRYGSLAMRSTWPQPPGPDLRVVGGSGPGPPLTLPPTLTAVSSFAVAARFVAAGALTSPAPVTVLAVGPIAWPAFTVPAAVSAASPIPIAVPAPFAATLTSAALAISDVLLCDDNEARRLWQVAG